MNHALVKMIEDSTPIKKCGYLDRNNGQICDNPAGSGTNHLGLGYCAIHDEQAINKIVATLGEDSEIGKALIEFNDLNDEQIFNLKNVAIILMGAIQQLLDRIDQAGFSKDEYRILVSSLKELRFVSEGGYKLALRKQFVERLDNYIKALVDACMQYVDQGDKLKLGEELAKVPYFINPDEIDVRKR
ncbi:MAG: hypothetical protein ACFE95_12370 [Candidatus Hodarchaeota archaeon]